MKHLISNTVCALGLMLTMLALPAERAAGEEQALDMHEPITGVAAGVPYIALPATGRSARRWWWPGT